MYRERERERERDNHNSSNKNNNLGAGGRLGAEVRVGEEEALLAWELDVINHVRVLLSFQQSTISFVCVYIYI